jgi:acyl dehydratase
MLTTKPSRVSKQSIETVKEYLMFDKSKVGQSFPPFTIEVERGKIRELALAIGDDNPIYLSKEDAQAAGYPDVPLYPTSPTKFAFWGNRKMIGQLASLGINLARVLDGEMEYEYLAPIYPGDTLTGVMTLVDVKSRQSQGGTSMDLLTIEIDYTNQHGTNVLKARQVIIVRE